MMWPGRAADAHCRALYCTLRDVIQLRDTWALSKPHFTLSSQEYKNVLEYNSFAHKISLFPY